MSIGVLFVIDCTGSMEKIHQFLGTRLSSIADMFADEGMPVAFAAVGFRDYKDVNKRKDWFELQDFVETDDHGQLSTWLKNIRAFGGGSNYGESSMAAFVKGIAEASWPVVRRRVVAIFTDDKAHVPDHGIEAWHDVRDAIVANEIEQVHLFTTERKIEDYDDLDGLGYDVIRHELAQEKVNDLDDDSLEAAVREFVRMSSEGGGFGGGGPVLAREETNPFDEPATAEPKDAPNSLFDVDWDVD